MSLAAADPSGLWVAHSADGGQTWSPPDAVAGPDDWGDEPALATAADGSLWLAARRGASYALFRSADGRTWTPIAVPEPFAAGCEPADTARAPRLFANASGGMVAALPRVSQARAHQPPAADWLHLSVDQGASWQPLAAIQERAPLQDVRLVQTSSGRYVALWSVWDFRGGELLASTSDDGGQSWSSPQPVSDAPYAPVNDAVDIGNFYQPRPFTPPLTSVVATASGGVSVAWLARTGAACMEVRVSRSDDGSTWQPSVAVGTTTTLERSPLSLAVDGRGRLVLLWRDADRLLAARSLDRVTWSGEIVVAPWDGTACAVDAISPLATAADGTVAFLASAGGCGADNVALFRSDSAGFAWDQHPTELALPAGEVTALRVLPYGAGLFASAAVLECTGPGCGELPASFVTEAVATPAWSDAPAIHPGHLLGADAHRWVYVRSATAPASALIEVLLPHGERHYLTSWVFPDGSVPDAVVHGSNDLSIVHVLVGAAAAELRFERAAEPISLFRDDSVRTLTPPPDRAASFPLRPYLPLFRPGSYEVDDVLHDSTRPLIFYQVADPGPLSLVKLPGMLIRFDW